MPRVTWDTEAEFDDHYRQNIRDPNHPQFGQWVGYGRLFAQHFSNPYNSDITEYEDRANELISAFGLGATDRIWVMGCGLGYLIEAFIDLGFTNIWGQDSSTHVANVRAVEARPDVSFAERGINSITPAEINALTGGTQFDWVITESVLESYDDIELIPFFNTSAARLFGPTPNDHVIHMIKTFEPTDDDWKVDPAFNRQSLADWKALKPDQSCIDYRTWDFL